MDLCLKNSVGIMPPEVQERALKNIRHMITELSPNYVSTTNNDSDFEGPSPEAPEPRAKRLRLALTFQ